MGIVGLISLLLFMIYTLKTSLNQEQNQNQNQSNQTQTPSSLSSIPTIQQNCKVFDWE